MDSLLNHKRPPVFCPGCAHEKVVSGLDRVLISMGLAGHEVVMVSDIGCSGLFDTFFNTHAFHGLHGRALTYATGIKMARPELTVMVTMGDGGLGIGGAHVLSACRRNLDLTLLVLNNFNYGMTGGQCSSTTPPDANVGSGFLNRLEKPVDICQVAGAAGAPYVARVSAYDGDLTEQLKKAIEFKGFSLIDIWGVCPGRYLKHNKISPKSIRQDLDNLPDVSGFLTQNARTEYGQAYRQEAGTLALPPAPKGIAVSCKPPESPRSEVVILGSAGQRVLTAGELLCLAGASAGLWAAQKNDYPITVMRGHSVSEVILSKEKILYTGIQSPSMVLALAAEGVTRRKKMLENLTPDCLVIKAAGVDLPPCKARIVEMDFTAKKIRPNNWALGALAVLAGQNQALTVEMLEAAVALRFKKEVQKAALDVVKQALS